MGQLAHWYAPRPVCPQLCFIGPGLVAAPRSLGRLGDVSWLFGSGCPKRRLLGFGGRPGLQGTAELVATEARLLLCCPELSCPLAESAALPGAAKGTPASQGSFWRPKGARGPHADEAQPPGPKRWDPGESQALGGPLVMSTLMKPIPGRGACPPRIPSMSEHGRRVGWSGV